MFGNRVKPAVKTYMKNLLEIHNEGWEGKYRGIPKQFRRNKTDMFQYINGFVKANTERWNAKFLSQGGKEVLLKSVDTAKPVFTMNIFKLPKTVCDEINGIMAKFWWSQGERK